MSGPITLDALDLAALLCSRVCHDLISPAGAIVNGLEVLEESKDEETRIFALDLIKKSARTASARLQFCRIAFGAAGSAGAQVDLGDAENVARGFIEDEKVKLAWNLPRALVPKNRVKLLLNMIIVATHAIPRGGIVAVEGEGPAEQMTFKITARGLNARIPPAAPMLLAGTPEGGIVDAHSIQPFYTGLLARVSGLAVSIEADGDGIVVAARSASPPAGA
jgi:histidine phosphotransferase ChpT